MEDILVGIDEATLNTLIDDILNNKEVRTILKADNPRDLVLARDYIEQAKFIQDDYDDALEKGVIKEKSTYKEKLAKVKEIELKLSMYVFNELFRGLLRNAKRIEASYHNPTFPIGRGFVSNCLKDIDDMGNLRTRLLDCRYRETPSHITTKREELFFDDIKNKLEYLQEVNSKNV